jgi:hypothetical protein
MIFMNKYFIWLEIDFVQKVKPCLFFHSNISISPYIIKNCVGVLKRNWDESLISWFLKEQQRKEKREEQVLRYCTSVHQ